MPQSLLQVLVHIVFSTKDRVPYIIKEKREAFHSYIAATVRGVGSKYVLVGGVEDHVHLLVELPRTITLSKLIEETKISSSKNGKAKLNGDFAWQRGYGAFSVSAEHRSAVEAYIQNQEEHHRKVSFEDEFRRMLDYANVEYDEKYVWD